MPFAGLLFLPFLTVRQGSAWGARKVLFRAREVLFRAREVLFWARKVRLNAREFSGWEASEPAQKARSL
jgi:hypothetical protein